MVEFHSLIKSFISLFVVVDVFGNIPIFVSLTSDMSPSERKSAFRVGILASFFILIVFGVAGDFLLHIFNVSVAGFQVAGGALLFFLSIIILFRGGWSEENLDSSSRGVFPIAFPLLAGPGAITTTILVLQRYGFMTSVLSVLIVSVLNFVILEFSDLFFRFLGKIGSAVVSRIMAVFISAIAVEYIITGIKTLLSASG